MSRWEERGHVSLSALFPNLQSVVVGGCEYLYEHYNGIGRCRKKTIAVVAEPDVEREQSEAFAHWLHQDIKKDVVIKFQWRLYFWV